VRETATDFDALIYQKEKLHIRFVFVGSKLN